jgi:hypothetical protein
MTPNTSPSPATTTTAALQIHAYNTLAAFFNTHAAEVVEIEILPPCFEPEDGICMQDGLNIGIPKKILVLAYLEARTRFFSVKAKARAEGSSEFTKVHIHTYHTPPCVKTKTW